MESTFTQPDEIRADAQEQQRWAAVTTPPEVVEPFEAPFDLPEGFGPSEAAEAVREPQDAPQAPPEDPDPFAGFDPEIRRDVEGLEHLGYLEDNFSYAGHNFTISTLHPEEELAAASVIQRYRGSLKEPDAWIVAQVAMALKSVDHRHDFCPPIGPDVHEFAEARFGYVSRKWFFPLIEYIYWQRYIPLQQRAIAAMEALQSKSQRNR